MCVCVCVCVWGGGGGGGGEKKKVRGRGRIAGGLGLTRGAVQWRGVCMDPSPPGGSHTCYRQSIPGGTCESYPPSEEKVT